MEQPAPFRNSITILLLLIFSQCTFVKMQENTGFSMNEDSVQIRTQSGITHVNGNIYSGTLYALYPNSKDTIEIKNYLDGKEDGEWKQFYPNQKLRSIRYFKEGKKDGEYIAWWPNGVKKLDYFFVDGEYQGTCREWSPNDSLSKLSNYNAGHEEDEQRSWYDNGKIRSNYVIINGRRFGLLGTKNCTNVSDSVFKK